MVVKAENSGLEVYRVRGVSLGWRLMVEGRG